ncbi:hypothetical protein BGZ63DRAFT_360972 [Mariannaea sp. PMI_226]|nr:hypothetical protein BGZ63DRAFT_360972 [Mariannaea sp. PMI_226]
MSQPLDVLGWANNVAQDFSVDAAKIQEASTHFVKQLEEGLKEEGSPLLQVPSFVTKLPDGSEKGVCLAIDLGGTNLRVCSVTLHGDSTLSSIQSKTAIPQEMMVADTYKTLFGFIAQHTESFMRQHMPEALDKWQDVLKTESDTLDEQTRQKHCYSLGFAFSFTFDQHAINQGTLMYWTKAFTIKDAVGRDPCAMLQEALDERSLPLNVTALVNDTVGTLAARAYCAPTRGKTVLGAIFGTGTNGAYMEKVSDIQKLHSNKLIRDAPQDQYMALNTEWGGFDRDLEVLPITRYDHELDRDSVNPDDQHYEKRISGMYLGELLRRVIIDGVKSGVLTLEVPLSSRLHIPYSIDSSFLSNIVRDESAELVDAKKHIVQVLGSQVPTTMEAQSLQVVAKAIGRRAARLSAIAIAGVVIQSGRLDSQEKPIISKVKPTKSWALSSVFPSRLFQTVYNLLRRWLQGRRILPKDSLGSEGTVPDSDSGVSEDIIDVGVDGSLFQFFPGFEGNLRKALREISEIGPAHEARIRMGAAEDGSGVGAALIAMNA